ncbi:hypothetical protein GALL_311930 [mine drainage metagenome]|uniref:Uncharacterized protein n=1 Tax=mine drainage metagenome TaxID=410659 RepID=A0A1J5QTH7_9ZZZZ
MGWGDRGGIATAIEILPDDRRNKRLSSEHLVHEDFEVMPFSLVNSDPDRAVLGQQLPQQHQARIHHRQPLAVLQLVVVVLERALGVVRRVDEDAFHLACIERNQRLERQQVVALDQQVVGGIAIGLFLVEQVIRHVARRFLGLVLVDPIEEWHFFLVCVLGEVIVRDATRYEWIVQSNTVFWRPTSEIGLHNPTTAQARGAVPHAQKTRRKAGSL